MLAERCSWARVVLVESSERRAAFLSKAARLLQLEVEVRAERAETTGRGPLREGADVVTARSFGSPTVVAECAAPLLLLGASLVVSEPPTTSPSRWPAAGLAALGLGPAREVEVAGFHFAVLCKDDKCPARYPRRPGVPAKRPLF